MERWMWFALEIEFRYFGCGMVRRWAQRKMKNYIFGLKDGFHACCICYQVQGVNAEEGGLMIKLVGRIYRRLGFGVTKIRCWMYIKDTYWRKSVGRLSWSRKVESAWEWTDDVRGLNKMALLGGIDVIGYQNETYIYVLGMMGCKKVRVATPTLSLRTHVCVTVKLHNTNN